MWVGISLVAALIFGVSLSAALVYSSRRQRTSSRRDDAGIGGDVNAGDQPPDYKTALGQSGDHTVQESSFQHEERKTSHSSHSSSVLLSERKTSLLQPHSIQPGGGLSLLQKERKASSILQPHSILMDGKKMSFVQPDSIALDGEANSLLFQPHAVVKEGRPGMLSKLVGGSKTSGLSTSVSYAACHQSHSEESGSSKQSTSYTRSSLY
jgi:hypothetical protein